MTSVKKKYQVVNQCGLHVRNAPESSADSIGELAPGTRVTLTEITASGEWGKHETGWTRIQDNTSGDTFLWSTTRQQAQQWQVLATSGHNYRTQPTTFNSAILGQHGQGTIITSVAAQGDWINHSQGFSKISTNTSVFIWPIATQIAEWRISIDRRHALDLRSAPSLAAGVVGSLPSGLTVYSQSSFRGWVRISEPAAYTGTYAMIRSGDLTFLEFKRDIPVDAETQATMNRVLIEHAQRVQLEDSARARLDTLDAFGDGEDAVSPNSQTALATTKFKAEAAQAQAQLLKLKAELAEAEVVRTRADAELKKRASEHAEAVQRQTSLLIAHQVAEQDSAIQNLQEKERAERVFLLQSLRVRKKKVGFAAAVKLALNQPAGGNLFSPPPFTLKQLQQAFDDIDIDRSGTISKEGLYSLLCELGSDEETSSAYSRDFFLANDQYHSNFVVFGDFFKEYTRMQLYKTVCVLQKKIQ